jgi:fructokinase
MRIGIDLGGTKIEGIALDEAGVERARLRVPTPRETYEQTVAAVAEVVAALERKAGVTRGSVGIAHPGALSPATGPDQERQLDALNGRPLKADLERALGREVRLANDANCFAVSEATDGRGQRLRHRVRRHPRHRRGAAAS